MKKLLHVGCGGENKNSLKGFNSSSWNEIRLDIDKNVHPDIVGTLTDMKLVESASVDALYSSHNIEHIFPHEVPIALHEFNRVLKDDGFVVITCPDLVSVCEAVVNDKLMEPLYVSDAGPISPIDILYGYRESIQQGKIYMAHKTGFTYKSLLKAFQEAGFQSFIGGSRPKQFDLFLLASKNNRREEDLKKASLEFLP
jgi:predicted SAM-dependent methyltransferase